MAWCVHMTCGVARFLTPSEHAVILVLKIKPRPKEYLCGYRVFRENSYSEIMFIS